MRDVIAQCSEGRVMYPSVRASIINPSIHGITAGGGVQRTFRENSSSL